MKQVTRSKQKQVHDKVNKHINNLYSAEIYNVSMAHQDPAPAQDETEIQSRKQGYNKAQPGW